MSPVKHKARSYPMPTRTLREVVVPMNRAEERAGLDDVGEQAMSAGWVPHFRFFVWGCPCLGYPYSRNEISPAHCLQGRNNLGERPLGHRLANRLFQLLDALLFLAYRMRCASRDAQASAA